MSADASIAAGKLINHISSLTVLPQKPVGTTKRIKRSHGHFHPQRRENELRAVCKLSAPTRWHVQHTRMTARIVKLELVFIMFSSLVCGRPHIARSMLIFAFYFCVQSICSVIPITRVDVCKVFKQPMKQLWSSADENRVVCGWLPSILCGWFWLCSLCMFNIFHISLDI